MLRAGYKHGCRAPSLPQKDFQQITAPPTQDDICFAGIFNNRSSVALAASIPQLTAETSRNFSAAVVFAPAPGLSLSADAHRIDIDNRILLSGSFGRDAMNSPKLAAALTAIDADRAQFFVNAANTRPVGLGELHLRRAGNFARHSVLGLEIPAALAYVNQDQDLGNNYVNQRRLSQLETGTPNAKIHAGAGYGLGKFTGLVRATYFGQVACYHYDYEDLAEGSNHLPHDRDIVPHEPVQMEFNGAFFHLKAAYRFGL